MSALRFIFFSTFVFFFWAVFPVVSHAHSEENKTVIHLTDNGFEPAAVAVAQGSAVVFENVGARDHWPASAVHPTHEAYAAFDPRRPIAPGGEWTFVFQQKGEWGMHDHLHPRFRGTITVVEDAMVAVSDEPEQGEAGDDDGFFVVVLERLRESFSVFVDFFTALWPGSGSGRRAAVAGGQLDDFRIPLTYDTARIVSEYPPDCAPFDFFCFAELLRKVAREQHPEAALILLERFLADGAVSRMLDEHQLAHEIGRQTAENYGVNAKAFLLCPMSSFNGGCQHGFFEFVLGKTDSAAEAADHICASFDDTYSEKFKFYCYHGVGHGVMMAFAYDLPRALAACDIFDSYFAQDGCWQGVFMENTNAGMGGFARTGLFSEADPLAPCNGVDEKYRHECYINHSGWLMKVFGNDIETAATACAAAGNHRGACVSSLGLLTTNPSWQTALGNADVSRNIEFSVSLCKRFPQDARADCFMSALDNIANYDEMDLEKRAIPFCVATTALWGEEACYRQIGINVLRQVAQISERRRICETLPTPTARAACMSGAGL